MSFSHAVIHDNASWSAAVEPALIFSLRRAKIKPRLPLSSTWLTCPIQQASRSMREHPSVTKSNYFCLISVQELRI